ncbi:MAG: 7-carboxy-7-deazaguanine synthase QueE [Candidatus Saccharicenans sp.]|jgi:organic radical activating enzyme|nr:7-carboxy-7-deazaguanine synthase QueE [Candidatus Saccharicenans sp.]MDH7575850.1 7-carboxy-7-deazaguanine synthase QueE [Candidatus Saccharicenans sp.]
MPLPPTLKIREIFFSAAGEGLRQGQPTIFVRFSGCNLRCSFCDTKHAWKGGQELWPAEILDELALLKKKYKTNWVCLTGGEPLLQDVGTLVRLLRRAGFHVHVETNGTRPVPVKPDWLTVSPKPPVYKITSDCLRLASEVKLVVVRSLKLEEIGTIRQKFPENIPLLLQPQSNAAWSYKKAWKLYIQAIREGLPNLRLSCQLHKIYGIK